MGDKNQKEKKMKIQEKLEKLYQSLQNANINEYVDKKSTGKMTLDYLSWGAAVDFFTKACHELHLDWNYNHIFESMGDMGSRVITTISIKDSESGEVVEKQMTLPCMTNTNQAAKGAMCDVMTVNKTEMRCLVKCMTLFGLGLKLYLKNFDELSEVKTGTQVADAKAKLVGDMKDRIATLLSKLDPTVDISKFANYKDLDSTDALKAMGLELKALVDTQGAGNANN